MSKLRATAAGPGVGLRAAGLFVVARLVGLAVLALGAGSRSLETRLAAWDGGYYLRIAHEGYPHTFIPHAGSGSRIGFFPAYPALVRVTEAVLPGADVIAAVVVSLLTGAAAAAVIAWIFVRVMRERVDEQVAGRVALVGVAAWSVAPASFVMTLAYSESLFMLLAASCLLFALDRRWVAAGIVGYLAGLTRANAVVLTLCLVVAAVPELRAARASASSSASAAPTRARPSLRRTSGLLLCAAAPLLGFLTYVGWLGLRVHRMGAWFTAERDGWKVYTDGGVYFVRKVAQYATHPIGRPSGLAVIAVAAATLALLVAYLASRPSPILATYSVSLVVLALTTHGAFGSIPRLLLPAFPVLLPLARFAARFPTRAIGAVYAICAVVVGVSGLWVTGQTVLPP